MVVLNSSGKTEQFVLCALSSCRRAKKPNQQWSPSTLYITSSLPGVTVVKQTEKSICSELFLDKPVTYPPRYSFQQPNATKFACPPADPQNIYVN